MPVGVSIDASDPTPPYEQLRRQLTVLISAGTLAPGTRLAPVRSLAEALNVAPGTVARAYKELEAAGLVAGRRGGGTLVLAPSTRMGGRERSKRLGEAAEQFVSEARLFGADDDTIQKALDKALKVS